MEPLDPKAELMRLAEAYRSTWPRHDDLRVEARAALESAITLALAAERRSAMLEAAKMCDKMNEQYNGHGDCADVIRALVDGKAGGT